MTLDAQRIAKLIGSGATVHQAIKLVEAVFKADDVQTLKDLHEAGTVNVVDLSQTALGHDALECFKFIVSQGLSLGNRLNLAFMVRARKIATWLIQQRAPVDETVWTGSITYDSDFLILMSKTYGVPDVCTQGSVLNRLTKHKHYDTIAGLLELGWSVRHCNRETLKRLKTKPATRREFCTARVRDEMEVS